MSLKSKKGKILTIILVLLLVVAGGVGGYFLFRNYIKDNELIFDYEKGEIANSRVESAQYEPDINKFIENNPNSEQVTQSIKGDSDNVVALSSSPTSGVNMTVEEFSELVDEYGTIENYAGAGKYLGYDIYEIKNEIAYVTKTVPAFNQWFRMPTMRENEGYVSIPYYEGWAYYLELNLDPLVLSITRVCWCTRSAYLDFENKTIVEDHDDGTSFVQYEIMKTNYYNDENGDEVVECFIYSVGVDNVENGGTCNTKESDYFPFEYQYLKNVKDKTLIKYHITVATRYADNDSVMEDFDFGEYNNSGMDIRGLNPYGVRREFTIINYDGYVNIDLTKIDQNFATLDNLIADGSVSFDISSLNIQRLVKNIGLSQEEYTSSNSAYQLMDKIAKQIIDNFEIKNNWAKIYKDSTEAIEIELIKGPFYGQKLPFSYLRSRIGFYGKTKINYDCDVSITNPNLLKRGAEYSLSLALKSEEDLYIIATDYHTLELNTEMSYIQSYINWGELTGINIDKDGEYTLVIVFTQKINGKDVVILDTNEPAYITTFMGFDIPDTIDSNNVTHSYSTKGVGGKLVVTVSSNNG
ncbi:MAG: hypothetical protein IJ008_04205 [Clostridia bacterium]|nr:hypothetical protein [Clostridia bacterium]